MEGEDPLLAQCRGRVGQLISGKWRLDALIGVGGMAAVYMATHRNGSVAAVKILHEDVALNEEVRERFLREAYIANKVGHPGTVKVLDDDTDEHNTPYLVMELLQGDSVEGVAEKQGGRLSIEETLDIIDQTLAVLESAHAHTIIHRDLKPENLFLTRDGTLKVLDFGIARLREENARKTQTGMVMGTPSFMAPEQAMGRWSDVDARTDLYAVGATAFTLLTGLPVHEAETAGEMLVAAATRPARSLARVLNNAPFNLVALVDRALSYERDNRFPDATAMRAELAKVRGTLGEGEISKTQVNPEAAVLPATVHGEDLSPDGYDRGDRGERVESYDPSTNSPEEIERMQTIFTLLERGLVARKQYSPDHPETKRRFDETFKELASALMTCDICLAWNFTPYAFVAGDSVVWEPEPPWNRVPYQLFSDGVRTMGLVPGMDESEFHRWLDLITLDPTIDLAPEDDMVTTLWDANFEHVFHQAIDSFAEGNQQERQRYEAERAAVIDGAHLGHEKDAAVAWREGVAEGGSGARSNAQGKTRQVVDFINRTAEMDAEAAARVQNLNMQEASPEEAMAAQAMIVDDSTRALLAARLELDVGATSERFVVAAAEAFVASAKMGRSQAVTAPLRRAVDGLSMGEPEKAMDMIIELRDTVKTTEELETENLRNTITAEILSPGTLLDILKGSNALGDDQRQGYLKGLSKVLECIQSQHFDAAIEFLPDAPEGKIRRLLLDFLKRAGAGHEPKLGALFGHADVELGLELVRLLVEMDSEPAREAISMASDSPHALVRIEALGHLEGVSGIRLRTEMRKLLDDDQLDVRLAALQAMEEHGIAVAGPFLVLRIQDKSFLKAPIEERRQSLKTLCSLRPRRGEEVCIDLLGESRLFRSGALESTRELAAEFLAEVAATDKALHALREVAASKPWQANKSVREAAAVAVDKLMQRAQEAAAAAEAARPRRQRKKRPRPEGSERPPPGGADGAERKPPATKAGARKVRKTRPGGPPTKPQGKRPRPPQAGAPVEGGEAKTVAKKKRVKKKVARPTGGDGPPAAPPTAGEQR
ncbi:MAG: protein kinase [Myxococcales bacterium]|jgi:serine/threonine protein kinase